MATSKKWKQNYLKLYNFHKNFFLELFLVFILPLHMLNDALILIRVINRVLWSEWFLVLWWFSAALITAAAENRSGNFLPTNISNCNTKSNCETTEQRNLNDRFFRHFGFKAGERMYKQLVAMGYWTVLLFGGI